MYILHNILYKESSIDIYSYILSIRYINLESPLNKDLLSESSFNTPYDYYQYLYELAKPSNKTLEDIRLRKFKGLAVDLDLLYRYYKTNAKVKEKYFKPFIKGKF